jgi:hypothetical protein
MATGPDPRFCRIHVDGPGDRGELREALAAATGGAADPYGVETEQAAIDVKDWDEHATGAKRDFPDGFLWFPFSVEPLWNDGVTLDGAVAFVAGLLDAVWARGWAAVAVCDYEDRLPHSGGYGASELPWPA